MSAPESPDKYTGFFIHKKNKSLIHSETIQDPKSGLVTTAVYTSNNGLVGDKISEGIFANDSLPVLTNDLLRDAVTLNLYMAKNGYKGVTKIKTTKNGTTFS